MGVGAILKAMRLAKAVLLRWHMRDSLGHAEVARALAGQWGCRAQPCGGADGRGIEIGLGLPLK